MKEKRLQVDRAVRGSEAMAGGGSTREGLLVGKGAWAPLSGHCQHSGLSYPPQGAWSGQAAWEVALRVEKFTGSLQVRLPAPWVTRG